MDCALGIATLACECNIGPTPLVLETEMVLRVAFVQIIIRRNSVLTFIL